jgi:hypothetical protein
MMQLIFAALLLAMQAALPQNSTHANRYWLFITAFPVAGLPTKAG